MTAVDDASPLQVLWVYVSLAGCNLVLASSATASLSSSGACSQVAMLRRLSEASPPDTYLTEQRCCRCLWRRKLLECVDAAPAVFIAASAQDQMPPLRVHRTAVADASPCIALHEPGTAQAKSDLHSTSAALATPHIAQQQAGSGSAECNAPQAQPSLPSLCYSCSHGGDVLCMELATGALVWSQLLPGRTAPGLCLHPQMLVWP